MQSGEGGTRVVGRERRHVAHTPSRRRLRLRGAYQPPSIISMRISIFYPVFPKFMQTSGPSSTLHSHPPSALRPNHQPPSCSVFYTFPSSSLVLSLPILPTYEPFPFVPVSLPLCPSLYVSLLFSTVLDIWPSFSLWQLSSPNPFSGWPCRLARCCSVCVSAPFI